MVKTLETLTLMVKSNLSITIVALMNGKPFEIANILAYIKIINDASLTERESL